MPHQKAKKQTLPQIKDILATLTPGTPIIIHWHDAYSDDSDSVPVLSGVPTVTIDPDYALTVSPGYFIALQSGWLRIAGCHYPNIKETPYGETLTVPLSWVSHISSFTPTPLASRTNRRRR